MLNNETILLKIKQRLNKLSSNDFDNIEDWAIIEAFNKAQSDWSRRNLHGINQLKEGDESSSRRIDDFQVLLTTHDFTLFKKDLFYETSLIPDNYFHWKRLDIKGSSDCCPGSENMVVYQVEEGNIPEILRDFNRKPSFEWRETVCTLLNNRVRIYTNNEFDIKKASLVYYRQPRKIEILGQSNPYTQTISTVNVTSEFKDDIVEVIIDEASKIIAGDIESLVQYQRQSQQVEQNN